VSSSTVVCGEVGLAGEVRAVSQIETRVAEAYRLGFTRFFLPKSNLDRLERQIDMELIGISSVHELLEQLFDEN